MTRIVTVNGHKWKLFDGTGIIEPAARHRPIDERKAAVLEEALAALHDGNFTEVAEKYRVTYYSNSAAIDARSVEGRNQVKNIAKKLRALTSK